MPARVLSPVSAPARRHDRPTRPQRPLRIVAGGRNRPALVALPQGRMEELEIELRVLEDEAIALVSELLPIARRLEFYATADGSVGAWNLAAALADKLTKYGRKFDPEPRRTA